jgi:iron(III) transport system substrate-binding protein
VPVQRFLGKTAEAVGAATRQLSVEVEMAMIFAKGFKTRFPRVAFALGVSAALVSGPVAAATSVSEVTNLQGADREKHLVEGAKKEGKLVIYTSLPVKDMQQLTSAFTKKYGVPVETWRAGSEKVLQRTVTEARGGRHDVDIIEMNGPELEALHREQLLQKVNSPHTANLMPQATRPHGEWVGTRLNVFVQAYNTNKVRKDDLPKSYADLKDPKWKGQLGIEAEDYDWLATAAEVLGEDKAVELFREVVAKNGMSVRKGHTLLTNLVASGEVPLALTVYSYKPEQLKNKGAPIDWFAVAPAIARPNGVAVTKNAPHPHAAVLFYDFLISEEGQKILKDLNAVPTNTKLESGLGNMELKFVSPAKVLDEQQKWQKLYNEIFGQAN